MKNSISLTIILISILVAFYQFSNSPHGPDFKVGCDVCHSPDSWKLDKKIYSYDHSQTKLPLEGVHMDVNCKQCHTSLIFSEAPSECFECHTDVHNNTVGFDCDRCHTPQTWLVSNITEIHQMGRFPLLGAHSMAECEDCHQSDNFLKFEPLGIVCIDCHQHNYDATSAPSHLAAGYSKDCFECHYVHAYQWDASGFSHGFFPLTLGHNIRECSECHQDEFYADTSPLCYSCHETNYMEATEPNHIEAQFDQECENCHSIASWVPSTFDHDANYFPIYSGEHNGEWNSCADCHTIQGNYSLFSCIDCHEHNKNEMDSKHNDENGYEYNSSACFDCHPNGSEDDK